MSKTARALIEDPNHLKRLSMASCWEIAVKAGLNKLNLGEPSRTYLLNALAVTKFDLLPITLEYATAVEGLPRHHLDAFDRLLIAQAISEGVPIVSGDAAFDAYPVSRIW